MYQNAIFFASRNKRTADRSYQITIESCLAISYKTNWRQNVSIRCSCVFGRVFNNWTLNWWPIYRSRSFSVTRRSTMKGRASPKVPKKVIGNLEFFFWKLGESGRFLGGSVSTTSPEKRVSVVNLAADLSTLKCRNVFCHPPCYSVSHHTFHVFPIVLLFMSFKHLCFLG